MVNRRSDTDLGNTLLKFNNKAEAPTMTMAPECARPSSGFIKQKRQQNNYKQPEAPTPKAAPKSRSLGGNGAAVAQERGADVSITTADAKLSKTSMAIDGFVTWLGDGVPGAIAQGPVFSIINSQELGKRLNIFSRQPGEYVPDWMPDKTDIAGSLKSMNFTPKYPIACINSMVGSCLTAEESTGALTRRAVHTAPAARPVARDDGLLSGPPPPSPSQSRGGRASAWCCPSSTCPRWCSRTARARCRATRGRPT